MTKDETIQVLQSIEDRAVDFPYMTACDWVAIAAAKRHLTNSIEVKEIDLEKEFKNFLDNIVGMPRLWHPNEQIEWGKDIAKHFFELGMEVNNKAQKGE